ncbi:purple acid phosphatase 3-like isoform X2 [Mercurialis annua]|uniref:purple acid phosphatase 3-like isoform X2 n=1 Tax=Mercurialis annua TaxID=3986 RepID=UPI00215F3F71|nr:purple acid phosphatase 3-like isoform X2 [Mercurialis annua]
MPSISSKTRHEPRVLAAIFASFFFVSSLAKLQRFNHPLKPDGSLSFLVVGDWGRRGFYNQSQVAQQMGLIGEQKNIDFVISTGDNFYDNGLKGVDDPAFSESFTKIYTAPSLQKQWYSVMGNHDYRGNATAQLDPLLTKKDSRWLCLRSFVVNAGEIVEFFFVDTSPFINDYFINPEHVYYWDGVAPRVKYLESLLRDLASALRGSTAKWKFVVGHHPIFSAGHHGNTKELIKHLAPLLKFHNVDAYINGHDHSIGHISSRDGVHYLTSGGGSKAWRGDIKKMNTDELKFYYDGQGFMTVEMTDTNAQFEFYDIFGNNLHQLNINKKSHSAM